MTTTTHTPLKEDLRREVDRTVADLTRLRDEIKVRLHLGGMEVVDTAEDLDRRLLALGDAARDAKGDALVAIRSALTELGHGLAALRKRVDDAAKR